LLALGKFVANVSYTVIGDFRHVKQTVGSRHYFDEGSEVRDALNSSEIRLVQLGDCSDLLDCALAGFRLLEI
jgi:hypothetical protein